MNPLCAQLPTPIGKCCSGCGGLRDCRLQPLDTVERVARDAERGRMARLPEIDRAEVNGWIPSLVELAESDKYFFMRSFGLSGTAPFGALAFLKLGRDDDAYELAKIAVSPEQKTEKITTFIICYQVLG